MIHKAFRYRLYPNQEQQRILAVIFGCVRFVFNFFLAMRKQEYQLNYVTVSYNRCSEELTALKRDPDHLWLNDADSTALQSALRDLDTAFKNMFEHRSGYPKFRSKRDHHDSYTSKNNNNSISVLCECEEPGKLSGGDAVGIDIGLRDFAVLSDSLTHIPNPEPLRKLLKKLKHEQRALSRKTKGSHRYELQRVKIARLHERICACRDDHHQKLSTVLIGKYGVIGIEDLDVRQLLSENSRDDARRISDSGWRNFVSMLEYKADWYGRRVIKVGRYYPSSQLCHDCGYRYPSVKEKRLTLWTCPQCGKVHQRDENASLNIRDEALRILAAI